MQNSSVLQSACWNERHEESWSETYTPSQLTLCLVHTDVDPYSTFKLLTQPLLGHPSSLRVSAWHVYMGGEVCPRGDGPGVGLLETSLGLCGQGTLESRVPEEYSRKGSQILGGHISLGQWMPCPMGRGHSWMRVRVRSFKAEG